ncbi:MAG: hypothetical protein AB1668_04365 [Nanoarchaeota archaeon]
MSENMDYGNMDNIGSKCDGYDTGCNPSYLLLGRGLLERACIGEDYTLGGLAAKITSMSSEQLKELYSVAIGVGGNHNGRNHNALRNY